MIFIYIIFGILGLVFVLSIVYYFRGGSDNTGQAGGNGNVPHANKFLQEMQGQSLRNGQDSMKRDREAMERLRKQAEDAMHRNQKSLGDATKRVNEAGRQSQQRLNEFSKQQMRNSPFGGFGKNKF